MIDWNDDSSVESVDGGAHIAPGEGHVYAFPFHLAGRTVRTYGDFAAWHHEMYHDFEAGVGEYADAYWSDLTAGLLAVDDEEEMDASSRDMVLLLLNVNMSGLDLNALSGAVSANEANASISDADAAMLRSAVEDLTFDVFDDQDTGIHVHVPDPTTLPAIARSISLNMPPLSPDVPVSQPAYLVLMPRARKNLALNLHEDWADTIRSVVDDFPVGCFDQYSDIGTYMTSRSNTRPRRHGCVVIRFEDGTDVNVGSHGFKNQEELSFKWNKDHYRQALAELMSAPGGEGLTCPTPSMMLHQMISACMSNALTASANVVVEKDNIDFMLETRHENYAFDITSSSGIWDKTLVPPADKPKWRTQSAISKYDVAKIIISTTDDDEVKTLFAKAVANCLALEYPKYYRKIEEDLPRDLELQSNIYDQINTMSQAKISKLGQASYEAALELGLEDVRNMDIHSQGVPWIEKRDTMISKLASLKSRTNVAVPPVAIGEVKSFSEDTFSIEVAGHHFQAGPYTLQGRSQGPKTHVDDCKLFRRVYPASAIVSESESRVIAKTMISTPTPAFGLTHRGPASEFNGSGQRFSEASNEIYSKSAVAQLAEVRADIARVVNKQSVPPRNTWQQVYLYKGKVSAWYMIRDRINSADGYRVDWFAVSSYPVLGSKAIKSLTGANLHLWPRQRFRSQEMKLMRAGPRRLKLTIFSMLEKSRVSGANTSQLVSAWNKLAVTLVSSTYASGKLYLTGRYLSSTMASPSSPFDKMAAKLVNPRNFADIFYLEVLADSLKNWVNKAQYRCVCPLLGLPRAYAQLESYWMCWVPDEFADSSQNFALCVLSLHDEARYIEQTMDRRCEDLESQLEMLEQHFVTQEDLEKSLRATCDLDAEGMLGWSWVGSLAAGHALQLRSDAAKWERGFSRGRSSRTLANHLTVRHSARLDSNNELKKGTVAEMMLDSGTDIFLSTITATYRFLFINRPYFFNHPKSGEHKEREISITDPDSRIVLSDAELICGTYGVTTRVDYLKDPGKSKKFFDKADVVLSRGGGIQSSDASRYGPNMSNFAIAIMLIYLGVMSMHLRWASVVYARMAHRKMLITKDVMPQLHKMSGHMETLDSAPQAIKWLNNMPVAGTDNGTPLVWYCTSHHMGQGMSHHSSSLLHAGGICVCVDAIQRTSITVSNVPVKYMVDILVTSDDSTLVVGPVPAFDDYVMTRAMRQVAARVFLQAMRTCRKTALTMVSVKPNLVKEMISAVKGEFNSQDTGIGSSCPILGFREMVTLVVSPSAPSLVGDYLNAHANAKSIALAGQGLVTGSYAHKIMIDMIEERWGLNYTEREQLANCMVLPDNLVKGASDTELVSSPSSWLNPSIRACLYRMAVDHNVESEDLDPHVRDTVFSPLMHIKVSMSRQHKKAITRIKGLISSLEEDGMPHQAHILESALRSTISSARTRNLGRVADRVRKRRVSPRNYGDIEFQPGLMLETTMNWIATLSSKMVNLKPGQSDVIMANKLAGFIRLADAGSSAYPMPPRLRRSYPERAKKPKYMTSNYGSTPFGIHAIDRSGIMVVSKITSVERESMQNYLALMRHRYLSEHVTYGGGFVNSWASMSTSHIVALDISGDIESQMAEQVMIGDFSPNAIRRLQSLQQENEGVPVLAVHRYDGVRGLWHAVYRGSPITVHTALDINAFLDTGRNFFMHVTETGREVICALQGFDEEPNFMTSEPLPSEVQSYQLGTNTHEMPNIVRILEESCMRQCRVKSATYCTTVTIRDEECLFYIAPDIHSIPTGQGQNEHIEYRRGGVIADLAVGGYWTSVMRGVCFRSWMKGHVSGETVWTGGTIGWRLSATSIPEYVAPVTSYNNVKDVIIGTGFDDPNQLTGLNPDFFSTGVKFVSQSNTETYLNAFRVGAEYRNLIISANYGHRFHSSHGPSQFMDTMLPNPPVIPNMDRNEAIQGIIELHEGIQQLAVW